jgi:hypothetical protein
MDDPTLDHTWVDGAWGVYGQQAFPTGLPQELADVCENAFYAGVSIATILVRDLTTRASPQSLAQFLAMTEDNLEAYRRRTGLPA